MTDATELTGIDISYAQATTPPLGAYAFVICKASQAGFVDPRWGQHSAATRAAGASLGAYHFGGAASRTPIADQVALFLATAAGADFLALDLEKDNYWPSSMTDAEAQAFIAGVHAAGRKIGLYHSLSGFPDLGQDWNWVAYWGSAEPTIAHAFWQYSSSEPGVPLDHDKFQGDAAALAAFLAAQEASDMGFDFGTGTATAGPSGARICTSADLGTAIASKLAAGAKVTILGGIAGWRVGVVNLGGKEYARWIPVSDIAAQSGNAALDAAVVAGAVPTAGHTDAELAAAQAAGYAAAKAKAIAGAQAI